MSRRHVLRGASIAFGVLLCIAIVFVVRMGYSYDGKCGGFFPGLSARMPCSFLEYVFGDMLVIAILLVDAFWPWLLAFLVLPIFVGYLLDRRGHRHGA